MVVVVVVVVVMVMVVKGLQLLLLENGYVLEAQHRLGASSSLTSAGDEFHWQAGSLLRQHWLEACCASTGWKPVAPLTHCWPLQLP